MSKTAKKILFLLNQKKRLFYPKYSLMLLICTCANFYSASAFAEIAVNQSVKNQPLIIEGITQSSIAAVEITQTENTSTGYCDGFTSRQPNHVLAIDNFFSSLRLEVESIADTTIVVRGKAGIWCNDDVNSANPIIEGVWQPGIYQVWIGTYQKGSSNSYRLKIRGQ